MPDTIFPAGYMLQDLLDWNKRIVEVVDSFGLDYFKQDFEICDYNQMLGFITYSGMPAHYPHWSYGKSYERQKTLYDLGISGLPYEMVINSDPCLAYLMRDNSLALQILTIAHVYAHNDFFKNNRYFSDTDPKTTIERFKTRADRIRSYVEDPSIGQEKVERILDAAHALQFQINPNRMMKKHTRQQQQERIFQKSLPPDDPYQNIHQRQKYTLPDLNKIPLEPEQDLLSFIRDYHTGLTDWEKDLLTIVHEEAEYFLPQMETKIMNEGWASYWHYKILSTLDLSDGLKMEFYVRHHQVLRPMPGGLNPYHLGFKIFEDIVERYDNPSPEDRKEYSRSGGEGISKIFQVRESERDASFLRTYLTEQLAHDIDLFVHEKKGNDRVITEVADQGGFEKVKAELIRNVGSARLPTIKIIDADLGGKRTLVLQHYFDGRELDLGYADKTLSYIGELWGGEVLLDTQIHEKQTRLTFKDGELKREEIKVEKIDLDASDQQTS